MNTHAICRYWCQREACKSTHHEPARESEGETEALSALICNSPLFHQGISKISLIFLAAVFLYGYNSIQVPNYDEQVFRKANIKFYESVYDHNELACQKITGEPILPRESICNEPACKKAKECPPPVKF